MGVETYASDGLRDVDKNKCDWQSPGTALERPEGKHDEHNDVAHETANDHQGVLGRLVLLEPHVHRRCVVVRVVKEALDFEEGHIGEDVDAGERDDEDHDDDRLKDLDPLRRLYAMDHRR